MSKTINNYQIISKIASGGMSEVYLAQDINTGKKVAIKILDAKLSIDPDYLYRFKKEASICKQLDHENIVKIISYGAFKNNYYIAYEYIEGITLDKFIKQYNLTITQIEKLSVQILKALSYAHSKNIIHRDIKPSNIIIEDQTVKILDFGIAKQQLAATVTKTGLFMGSPHYVSPEQIEGHDIDNRSDIYSFGIVLYEMIQGTVPFSADTPWGIIRAHLDKKEPEITKYAPIFLKEVVYKCLSKRRQDRFKSADDIISVILNREEIGRQTVIIDRERIECNGNYSVEKVPIYEVESTPSGLAIGSLACSIISITPFVGWAIGLAAIIMGIIDLDNIRNFKAGIRGKKFDITGIILGLILPWILSMVIIITNYGEASVDTIPQSSTSAIVVQETTAVTEKTTTAITTTTTETFITEPTNTQETYKNDTTSDIAADYEKIRKQDLAEEKFLDNMYSLLDEYNSVTNHINTYGGENLTFGQSNTIEFESSILARYHELANKLRNFKCPSSYINDKNNLILIAELICFYQDGILNSNKSYNYNAYINNFNACYKKISELFDYTNKMVDIHNKKYH